MKLLLCLVVALGVFAHAAAESSFRYAFLIERAEFAPVVGTTIGTLPHLFGTGLTAEAWGLVGVNDQKPLVAFAGVLPLRMADNAKLYLGAGARFNSYQPVGVGLVVGFDFKF